MSTDWQLIRKLINSTLDACEAIDRMDISDQERAVLMGGIAGEQGPTVWDGLQSAYIAPENLRYSVIRGRGRLDDVSPFIQPVSRILQQMGLLAAELVGAEQLQTPLKGLDPYRPDNSTAIAVEVENLAQWYKTFLVPEIEQALSQARVGDAK